MTYSYGRVLRFAWQFIKPYKIRFFIGTSFAAIAVALGLYQAYAVAKIVDYLTVFEKGDSLWPVYAILIIWLCSVIAKGSLASGSKYINNYIGEKAVIDAQMYAINHMSMLDMSWHEKENSGNKMKRLTKGADSIKEILKIWTQHIVEITVTFVGAIFILSKVNPKLGIMVFIYQIVFYLIASFTRKRALRAVHQVNIKDEEVNGLCYEVIANVRTVKVLGMAKPIIENAKAATIGLLAWMKNRIFWYQTSHASLMSWEGVARISLFLYIIYGIVEGQYQVGFLVLFYGYFNSLTMTVNKFTDAAQEIATAKLNMGRLTDIVDQPVTIDKTEGKVDFPKKWDAIRVQNLSFTYGDHEVLSGINLEIKKGEKIGIVGLSGAGKSTMFKLLLKEHEDYKGDILIGDVPLNTISKKSYTNHIAAVLQETEVFNMSLQKNIVLANTEEYDNEKLFKRSLTIAHVNDFIPKLPLGIETMIGEKGVKLSGGERQRLGIARAVFKNPEILFLDEATSHLDVESEQKIQDSLQKFFKNVTAVVIAHRLSTIREMDRIIVIEKGKIIESGTFDELSVQSGRFREFWDKQKA